MCMRHQHRVLVENGIEPTDWAVLSAGNYLRPRPPNELILEARLESEDDFSTSELKDAAHNCLRHGWIFQTPEGVGLTEEGLQLKERLNQELNETVELF